MHYYRREDGINNNNNNNNRCHPDCKNDRKLHLACPHGYHQSMCPKFWHASTTYVYDA